MSEFFEQELRDDSVTYKLMNEKNPKQDKNDDKETYSKRITIRKVGVLKSSEIHYKVLLEI